MPVIGPTIDLLHEAFMIHCRFIRDLASAWGLMLLVSALQAQAPTADIQTSPSEQLIRPGDMLALAYIFEMTDPTVPYRIEAGDLIDVHLRYSPEMLSFQYAVPPDGMVSFRGTDQPINVIGQSIPELVAELKQKYAPVFSKPEMNVNVKAMRQRDQVLLRLFQSNDGQQPPYLRLPVPGDGSLNLPLLERIPASGRSASQLGREITRLYRDRLKFNSLTVSVWHDELGKREASVLGAVRSPGSVSVGGGARLWDAIARAGGFTGPPAAVRALVIDDETTPRRTTYLFSAFLETAAPAQNPLLHGGELIWVGDTQ